MPRDLGVTDEPSGPRDLGLSVAPEDAAPAPHEGQDLHALADAAADRHGIDRTLFRGLITAESDWNPRAQPRDADGNLRSSAKGLGQLIDSTAADVGVTDAFDPAQNIEGSAKYLRSLADRYNGDWERAVAAYHDGPGAVDAGSFDAAQPHPYVAAVIHGAVRDASLAAFKAENAGISADQGAAALDHAAQTGLSPSFVAQNLPAVQEADKTAKLKATLAPAPVTAKWMAQSPAHAVAAADDADNLTFLEWLFQGHKTKFDWQGGKTAPDLMPPAWRAVYQSGMRHLEVSALGVMAGLRRAVPDVDVGSMMGAQGPVPAGGSRSFQAEQEDAAIRATSALADEPVPGANTLPRKMTVASGEALPPMVGLMAGGVPFLVAQSYGDLHNHFSLQQNPDGTPRYTEDQVQGLAVAGSTATGVILGKLGPALGGKVFAPFFGDAERAAIGETAQAAFVQRLLESDALGKNLLGRAAQLGEHVLSGIGFMSGQALINEMTSQSGDVMTGGKYDASKAWQVAKRSAADSLLILPLLALGPGKGALEDVGKAWRATNDAAHLSAGIGAAGETKILKVAPDHAQPLLDAQSQAGDPARQTTYIPVEAFDAAMAAAGHDPAEVAASLADGGAAYREAKATGGDVAIPTAEVLGKLAPAGLADSLLPDAKFDPEGMTLREAQQIDLSKMTEALSPDAARAYYASLPPDEMQRLNLPLAQDMQEAQARRIFGGEQGLTTPDRLRTPENVPVPADVQHPDVYRDFLAKFQDAPAAAETAHLYTLAVERFAESSGLTPQEVTRRFEVENAQGGEGQTLHQEAKLAPLWHSALENAAVLAKQAKGTPESWLAVLSKSPGVKAEEIRETGVDEWLKQQNGTVTREAVADFIKQHRVDLQEKVLGGLPFSPASEDALIEQRRTLDAKIYDWADTHGVNAFDIRSPEDLRAAGAPEEIVAAQVERDRIHAELNPPTDTTKTHYESYTAGVHKPSTYRELLLTSPAAADYNAPHFGNDSQGIIAHARIGETTDAQGRKVLMVEEIQSDLHQQGRTEGYAAQSRDDDAQALQDQEVKIGQQLRAIRAEEARIVAATEDPRRLELARRIDDLSSELTRIRAESARLASALPDVPWKDSWEELMVRRLVRYAAEHGFRRIALTPGGVHTDRYGTPEIAWRKDGEGRWRVNAVSQRGGQAAGVNIEAEARARGLLNEGGGTVTNKDELRHILGRADAEGHTDKVWDRMQKEDSGLSRPRAEGFEQAYDKRLKGAFDKQLKKYGGKMETEAVAAELGDIEAAKVRPATSTLQAHVADLPPELAQKALAEGQPLFQLSVEGTPLTVGPGSERGSITIGPATPEGRRFTINLASLADESTLPHEALYHAMSVMLGDLAKEPNASPELVEMHETLAKEIGYANGAERHAKIDPAKEEFGADAFERYLYEGKAPSPELEGVFAKFKQWFTRIYRQIRGTLTPELRSVFDRMFVAPEVEEIAQAPKRPQSPALAAAGARAKEARDLDTAYAAYAAQRIAEKPLGTIRPATYEQRAKMAGLKMAEMARNLETARQGVAQTKVITPQNHAGEPATYKLVEAKDLIASHTPDSFSPDPRYPAGVQERDYMGQQGEQGKVVMGAKGLNPALVLSDTPTAVDGPPLITSGARALALGGNGRSLMIKRAYAEGEPGERYKAALQAKAPRFGIAPEAVEAMKEPVLVRSIDAVPDTAGKPEMAAAVRRFNEGLTQALSPRLRAVAEARVLTPQTIASIGDLLGKGDESLRNLLRDRPKDFLDILERDGIVNNENRAQFVRGGELTDEAKDRIEGMFLGRVMGSGERLEATPPSLSAKVERAAPFLMRVAGREPGMDEIGNVQGALDMLNESARRGVKLDDLLDQRTAFMPDRRFEPREVAMARLLASKSAKDIGNRFKAWADIVAPERQGGLFSQKVDPASALPTLFAGQKDDISGPSRPSDQNAQQYAPPEKPETAPTFALNNDAAKKADKAKAAEQTLEEAQQQHLTADHFTHEAERVKAEQKKITGYLTERATDEKRGLVQRADREIGTTAYTDAHDAIMEALGFRQPSGRNLSVEAAVAQIGSDDRLNFDPDALKTVLDKPAVRQMRLGQQAKGSLDGLTLDEANVVQAAIRNIRHAANAAVNVVRDEHAATYADDARQIMEDAANRPPPALPPPSSASVGGMEKASKALKGVASELDKPEMILRRIGKVGEAYFNEYLKARSRGEELQRTVGSRIQKSIDAMPAEMRRTRFDAVNGPPSKVVDQGKWVRQDLMMLWAWMGTDSSAERAAKGLGISKEQIHQTLDQLTKPEKDFIQHAVWDVNDEVLKPLLLEQTAKNTGVPMETIDARPVTTKDGDYRGGFHHASYNREASQKAAVRNAAEFGGVGDYYGDLKSGWATGTPKGFTKARVEGAFDVPNLDWNSYGSHINAVIHYLAVDDFVKSFGGLLRREDARQAIQRSVGPEGLRQLDDFLRVEARGYAESAREGSITLNRILGGAFRSRAATSAFSLNIPIVLGQLSHLGVGAFGLKMRPDHLLYGIGKAFTPGGWRESREASANLGADEIGHRWNNYGEKMHAMLAGVGPEGGQPSKALRLITGGNTRFGNAFREGIATTGKWTDAASWSMYHAMDGFLSQAFWHAEEHRQRTQYNVSPDEAAAMADRAVRDVMPPMSLAENSSYSRDKGLIGSLLLVRRFQNTIYNLGAQLAWEGRNEVWNAPDNGLSKLKAAGWGTATAAGAYLGMTLSAHLLGRYLMGHGRKEDERETVPQWIARQVLIGLFYALPFGEEAATPFVEHAVNKKPINADAVQKAFRAPPAIAVMEDEIRDVGDAFFSNKPIEDKLFAGSEVIMRARGLPVAPIKKQGKFIYDSVTGRLRANGPADLLDQGVYGKKKPGHREKNPFRGF